ncbi:MAG: oligosaccharide flippase family protein [Verrucomicrobiota bacterium]|nr:oligosaccharide flippase family protein [Limisphaera sp.]MDW8380815.1 oligosaccharide flippase family protein [Verrucomicrobiota bacterium]
MSLRKQVLKGTGWVALGEGVSYAASFCRNAILARMLSKADFGTAAVFGMVMGLLEFTAKLGVARFLIRDKEGDDPVFIATAHALQAGAAALSAVAIILATPWLAKWFELQEHAWALGSLAGVVLLRGLEHLDVRRYERHLRFGPSALVEAVPQVVTTLAAWPVARWLGDYRAVLVLLLAKAGLSMVLSHALAERRYALAWHREYGRRMLQFGWPLVLNGFLMFGILQGDQFLVGTYYSLDELASYAAASMLVMAPHFMVGRVFNSIAFPLVARVQDDSVAFPSRYRQVLAVMFLYAAVSAAVFISGAEVLMPLIFGVKYAGTGGLLAWVAAVAAFRSLRVAVAVANLAKGDSQSQLFASLYRVGSLGPALLLAIHGMPLWTVAASGLIGEAFALGVCAVRLWRRDRLPIGLTLRPALGLGILCLASNAISYWTTGTSKWLGLLSVVAAGSLAGLTVIISQPELRAEARALWHGLRHGGPKAALRRWLRGAGWECAPSES